MSIEAKLAQTQETVAFLERLIVNLRAEVHRLRLRDVQVHLEERIQSLPTDAKERLRKAFPGTEIGGLKQAINIEKKRGANG